MRSRGVVGKRVVAIRQRHYFDDLTGKMSNEVLAVVLENGWELVPFPSEHEDSGPSVDFLIRKPEKKPRTSIKAEGRRQ